MVATHWITCPLVCGCRHHKSSNVFNLLLLGLGASLFYDPCRRRLPSARLRAKERQTVHSVPRRAQCPCSLSTRMGQDYSNLQSARRYRCLLLRARVCVCVRVVVCCATLYLLRTVLLPGYVFGMRDDDKTPVARLANGPNGGKPVCLSGGRLVMIDEEGLRIKQ